MPALTKETNPDEELIVQTLVVDEAKVAAPVPADTLATTVGALSVIEYEDAKDASSKVIVRGVYVSSTALKALTGFTVTKLGEPESVLGNDPLLPYPPPSEK